MNERRIGGVSVSDVLWIAVGLIVLVGLAAAVARDDSPDQTNDARYRVANAAIVSTQQAETARLERVRSAARHKEDQMDQMTANRGASLTTGIPDPNVDRDRADLFPSAANATPTATYVDPNDPGMVILGHPAPDSSTLDTTTLNLDRDGADIP